MSTTNEVTHAHPPTLEPLSVQVLPPAASHGAGMWRVAESSGSLDLNSSYMYLVFARDFADTCRVALFDEQVVGFVLGYRRPEHPGRLFIWQIAVDEDHRGAGIAAQLLDDVVSHGLLADDPVTHVETTITVDNNASRRLFAGFAARWDAPHETGPLFEARDFPDEHDAEHLHRIGPFPARRRG